MRSNYDRLDFIAFTLAQPSATVTAPITATQCLTDTFTVSGQSNSVPTICGVNTNYHSLYYLVAWQSLSTFILHLSLSHSLPGHDSRFEHVHAQHADNGDVDCALLEHPHQSDCMRNAVDRLLTMLTLHRHRFKLLCYFCSSKRLPAVVH